MPTPNSNFEKLLKDIEPSSSTKSDASGAHGTLRERLRVHPDFSEVLLNTYLSGSYRRDTAIRPKMRDGKVDRPDVDVIAIVDHSLYDDPEEVVEEIYSALSDNYSEVRKQQRSVRVSTAKAEMDVVPIIAPNGEDGTLYIPDRKLEAWLETNPPKHTTWTTEVNTQASGRFKPLVKLTKWWRRENPTVSTKPKGFVLECIAAECMSMTEQHYGELFVGMLEDATDRYAWSISIGSVPRIDDPGVPGNSVTDGITCAAFEGFYKKAKAHAEIGRRALEEEDPAVATNLWRQLFGDRFPEVSKSAQAAGLLGGVEAARSTVFPDRPVRPQRPRGFG